MDKALHQKNNKPVLIPSVSLKPRKAYTTEKGTMYHGFAEQALNLLLKRYEKKIQLIFTSPPFPLNRKKKYDNVQGEAYVIWLSKFAEQFRRLLKPNGSIVMEMGNAWEPGKPIMSTLALRALLQFLDTGKLLLCQQFICYNPARLPGPAQWVTVERIRLKDAYTHVWWMSGSERPNADNRRVLQPYSESMKRLLVSKKYNAGRRPSEHNIGKTSFLRNNDGAIPANVLTFANTKANDAYQEYCRNQKLEMHPARMPAELAEFFIKFLTEPGDIVLDPFSGSNITGACAERLNRRWLSVEANEIYIKGSRGRFLKAK